MTRWSGYWLDRLWYGARLMAKPALPEWPQWMSLKVLASYSCIGSRKLRALVKAGTIPSVRSGRIILVHRHEFDSWLASSRRPVGAESVNAIIDEIRAGRH